MTFLASLWAHVLGVIAYIKSFIPVASSAPAAPAAGPQPPTLSKLAQIVLTYNNQQAYWVGGVTTWTVAAKGVTVNKASAAQCQATADQLEATIPSSAPMQIPCALIASESVFDPKCQNGNFAGSNPSKSPWGYDDGLCQLKLCDIEIDGKTGAAAFSTPADAQAFAFDVTKAIPYFWGIYNAHLATADKLIAGNTRSDIDPRLMNRWILAALCYKQGDTGAATIFASGQWPSELNNFVSLEQYFAGKLGVPSLFAGLT